MAIETKHKKRPKTDKSADATTALGIAQKSTDVETDLMAIWRRADERASKLTQEEIDQFPHDGARNYRHYLYGHPKQD